MRHGQVLEFANGGQALLVPWRDHPVAALVLQYRVGSRHESPTESGLAHLLEHLTFKGLTGWPEGSIDRACAELGGSLNAMTDLDSTVYHYVLPGSGWRRCAEIEAARMGSCSFSSRAFHSEREVVLEELASHERDPWTRVYDAAQGHTFLHHPYGRPVIGMREVVAHLGAADARAFHAAWYRPRNACAVLVGGFDVGEAKRVLRRTIGAVRPAALNGGGSAPPISDRRIAGEKRVLLPPDEGAPRCVMAWACDEALSEGDVVRDVLSSCLNSGETSPLHDRLVRDKRLLSTVGCEHDPKAEAGIFWLWFEPRNGVHPDRAEDGVRAVLTDMARRGPGSRRLERAKTALLASDALEREGALSSALRLGEWWTHGDAQGWWRYPAKVRAVTGSQVRQAARDLFRSGAETVVWS